MRPEQTRTFRHAGRAMHDTLSNVLTSTPIGHTIWLLDDDAVVPIRTKAGVLNVSRLTARDRMYLRRKGFLND